MGEARREAKYNRLERKNAGVTHLPDADVLSAEARVVQVADGRLHVITRKVLHHT